MKWIFRFFWLFLFVIAVYWCWQVLSEQDRIETAKEKQEEKPLLLEHPDFMDYEKSFLNWKVSAEKGFIYQKSEKIVLKKVNGTFYDIKDPKQIVHLVADEAVADQKTKLVKLNGSIQVKLSDGAVLTTSNIIFDSNKKLLFTKEKFDMVRGIEEVTGTSFKYNLNTKKYIIKNPNIKLNL